MRRGSVAAHNRGAKDSGLTCMEPQCVIEHTARGLPSLRSATPALPAPTDKLSFFHRHFASASLRMKTDLNT